MLVNMCVRWGCEKEVIWWWWRVVKKDREWVVEKRGDETGFEWCVKERGEERYCRRAGVMSTNEEEEEEGLPA